MTQLRVRKTKWDQPLREPVPPSMAELVGRLVRLEEKRDRERSPAATAH